MQESIYERFIERAIRRVESIRSGNPLDSVTQMGAQVSHGQLETILNYIDIGKRGRRRAHRRAAQAAGR